VWTHRHTSDGSGTWARALVVSVANTINAQVKSIALFLMSTYEPD
jgi:hypothetical protein